MIEKITIQNFFSFGQTESIELDSETNILIGINGSGKSNFIKAIHFLYESIAGDGLEKLFSVNWGGFESVANFSNTGINEIIISYEFDCSKLQQLVNGDGFKFQTNPIYQIKIEQVGNRGYKLSEWFYNENSTINHKSPFTYLKVENGYAIASKRGSNGSKIEKIESFNQNELLLRQLSDPEIYFPLFTIKKIIEQISIYNYFDTTSKSPIRGLSPYYSENKLLSDGINLTFLLNYLNGNETMAYDKIMEVWKNINPLFRELVFTQPTAGKTLLGLKEQNLRKTIPIENLSDGTIRFLLLLSILYNPNRGKLVCIDEPEIGLHPDMINTVAKGIKYASLTGTQMIIATHSPLLLNNFELEDLMIFEKNKDNQTTANSKTEEDFESWEGEFLVGQMWLSGKLGGVRW